MKTITYTVPATTQLRRLPANIRERLIAKLRRYAADGSGDVTVLTVLKGQIGARLRVGDYRIIFVATAATISVRALGHRREIYE